MTFKQTFDLKTVLFRLDGQEVSHDGTCLVWKATLLKEFYKCLVIPQYPSVYFDDKCRKLPVLREGNHYRFAVSSQAYQAQIRLSVLFHTFTGDILFQSEDSMIECEIPKSVLDYEIQVFIKNGSSENWIKFYALTIDELTED